MSHTVYASFANPEDAEKAAGALLDHGVRPEDLSLVQQGNELTSPRATASNVGLVDQTSERAIEATAPEGSVYGTDYKAGDEVDETPKSGITTTTAGDAGAGAVKGTMIGAGVGAIAALAALIVPGVGLVVGAGALAAALGSVAAMAGAGAAAGAFVGYLKDMGVDDAVASDYGEAVEGGGAVLAVTVPSGEVNEEQASAILHKYAASNVNRYESRVSVQ